MIIVIRFITKITKLKVGVKFLSKESDIEFTPTNLSQDHDKRSHVADAGPIISSETNPARIRRISTRERGVYVYTSISSDDDQTS